MRVETARLALAAVSLRGLGSAVAEASGELNRTLFRDSAMLHALPEVGQALAAPDLALQTLVENAFALANALDQLQSALRALDGPPTSRRAV